MSNEEYNEIPTVILTLEDDSEIECEVLAIFDLEEKSYIALLPMDEEDAEPIFYNYIELENDEIDLSDIEDDDEYDKVTDAFIALMEAEEEETEE